MIELRWIVAMNGRRTLQYRKQVERYTEHHHWLEWGEWKEVESVVE